MKPCILAGAGCIPSDPCTMQTPPQNGETPQAHGAGSSQYHQPEMTFIFILKVKGGGGRCTAGLVQNSQAEVGGLGGDKNPGGHVGPCPHVPFPAARWLLPRARPARDVFGSTKRGVRGRQGAEGGSLSYKTRSQQALRNKSRVPEQPTPPPRTDRRWEGGGCSQRAGRAAPPMAGAGGAAACVPPPRAEEIPAARGDPRSWVFPGRWEVVVGG